MASSTRIKGNALKLEFGDNSAEDFWADATSVVLENEEKDSDVVTFYDAAHPGDERQWFFTLGAIQSTEDGSLWRYLWENVGEEIAYTYAPHGNEDPSSDKPHFIGKCKIKEKPQVGGEADEDGTYTFEIRLDVTTGPTMDSGD